MPGWLYHLQTLQRSGEGAGFFEVDPKVHPTVAKR